MPPTDDQSEMAQPLFGQAMDIWIRPEIDGRQRRGVLPPDFRLSKFQVIFRSPLDSNANSVRLNEEVSVLVRCRLDSPVNLGDPVSITNADQIEEIRLADGEDRNAAHLTGMKIGDDWFLGFDFTYNRARASEHLAAAEEFLTVSRHCLDEKRYRAAVENLYAALELAAMAEMLFLPRKATKRHPERAKRLQQAVQLGNAPPGVDSALHYLAEVRRRARYFEGSFNPSAKKLEECYEAAANLISHVRQRLRSE